MTSIRLMLCSLFAGVVVTLLTSGSTAFEGKEAASDPPLRVMSFNIRYDNPADGEDAWPHRIDKVSSMIRFHRADLVGIQEALRNQIDDLQEELPEFAWFGVGRDDGVDAGEFSNIFYRRDRLEPLRYDTFWLSETPDIPGSRSWDAAITRIATWGVFRDLETNREFFVLNTHFDHRGNQAREESARLIVSRLESLAGDLPILVIGDFNVVETSSAYAVLTEVLDDAFYTSEHGHHGPTSTWNGFREIVPNRRIDFIFVDDQVRVIQHGILADTWDGRFPSDHLPVLAEIELR